MPLSWVRGYNPYTRSDFQVLGAGPGILPAQVVHLASDLSRELAAGWNLELHGRPITASEIHEASSHLRDPQRLAEERLLAHAPPPAPAAYDPRPRRRELLTVLATLLDQGRLPEWDPGRAGDAEDCVSDIVFDV